MTEVPNKVTSLPGNEFADSFFGRFMAAYGELPTGVIILLPGIVVGGVGLLAGTGEVTAAVAGTATSAFFAFVLPVLSS